MNMQVGKHIYDISNDRYCYTLSEVLIIEKGKKAGEEALRTIGYYSTLETLLKKMYDLHILRKQECDDVMIELKESIKTITKELIKSLNKEQQP